MILLALADVVLGGERKLEARIKALYGDDVASTIMRRYRYETVELRKNLYRGNVTEDHYLGVLLKGVKVVKPEEFKKLFKEALCTPVNGALEVVSRIIKTPSTNTVSGEKFGNCAAYVVADFIKEESADAQKNLCGKGIAGYMWSFCMKLCTKDPKFFDQAIHLFNLGGSEEMMVYIDSDQSNISSAANAKCKGRTLKTIHYGGDPVALEKALVALGFEFA